MSQVPTATGIQHLAMIMDGNGRWATAQGKGRLAGHEAGITTVRTITEALIERHIPLVTYYAFSTENWKRPQDEVSGLFNLFRRFFKKEMNELHKKGVRIQFIGDHTPKSHGGKIDDDVVQMMQEVTEQTAGNRSITAQFAINYSGRDDITRAVQAYLGAVADGNEDLSQFSQNRLAAYLDTAAQPDVDLLIRTSGEQRISNYLLWQIAYAEMAFTDKHWPAFDEAELDKILNNYQTRERRFGGLPSSR